MSLLGGVTMTEPNLDDVAALAAQDRWLAVLCTRDPAGVDPDIAVVNAGVVAHPVTGERVLGFVGRRGRKLQNLRARPVATLVFRAGWEWIAVRGPVELAGPDDAHDDIDAERRVTLMRDIFHAAGGRHPDLEAYDRAMAEERRVAVLLHPEHAWSNPPGAEHVEPQEGQSG